MRACALAAAPLPATPAAAKVEPGLYLGVQAVQDSTLPGARPAGVPEGRCPSCPGASPEQFTPGYLRPEEGPGAKVFFWL